jgi:hypothetical protein
MSWINSTLADQSADPNIIWKSSYCHHPLYGEHYHDNTGLINMFLPLLEEHKYDVYFNGHEHMMNYAQIPNKEERDRLDQKKSKPPKQKISYDKSLDEICWWREEFP